MSLLPIWKEETAGVLVSPPSDPIWVWAEKNLRFTATQSKQFHGRAWSLEHVPHTRIVFDFLRDPNARELHIEKSSAAAFSTAILVGICWYLRYRPCRVMYALNNEKEMRKVSKAILQPFLRQVFGDVVIDDKRQGALFIQLPRGALVEMGSPTEGFFANKQASIIVLDEYDIWPDVLEGGNTDPLSAARGRFKGSESFAKLFTLTAPQRKFDITRPEHWQPGTKQDRAYLSGNRQEFRIKCPRCGEAFAPCRATLHFEHLRLPADPDETEEGAARELPPYDMQRVRREAALRCPGCAHLVHEGRGPDDKAALVRAGSWVPTCFENPPDRWSARYNDTCALIGNSHLGTLAAELIDARGRSRHEHVQVLRARFAEPESDEDAIDLSLDHARRHCGTHERGMCPIVPWRIALVVDCQKGKDEKQPLLFKWMRAAFEENGAMYVIDYGATLSQQELRHTYERAIRYCGPDLPVPAKADGTPGEARTEPVLFYCTNAVIDSGYRSGANQQMEESFEVWVYPLCIAWGYRADGRWVQTAGGWVYTGSWHLIPFKGRSSEQMQGQALDTTRTTAAHPTLGQCEIPLHFFNDRWWKTELYHGILAADPGNPLDPRLKRYPRIYLPVPTDDLDEQFLAEITAERLMDRHKKFRNQVKLVKEWGVPSKRKNDYGDCLKMARVLWALLAKTIKAMPAP